MDKTIVVVAKTRTEFEDYVKNRTGCKGITCGTGYYSSMITFYGPEKQDFRMVHPQTTGESLRGLCIDELIMLAPLKAETYQQIVIPCIVASRYKEPTEKDRELAEILKLLKTIQAHFEDRIY